MPTSSYWWHFVSCMRHLYEFYTFILPSYSQNFSPQFQFHSIYCQGPKSPGCHVNSRAVSPYPSKATAGLDPAPYSQPCLAMGPWALSSLASACPSPQGDAQCHHSQPLVLREKPPMLYIARIYLIVYWIASSCGWQSPVLLIKKLLVGFQKHFIFTDLTCVYQLKLSFPTIYCERPFFPLFYRTGKS